MAERRHDAIVPGGGLTGETGDLTAGEEEPFIPAERREATDPELEGALTLRQRREADLRAPSVGTAAGAGATELADRGGGYGSTHGLAEDDPAYRMEARPEPEPEEKTPASGERPVRRGVDDFSPPDSEHL